MVRDLPAIAQDVERRDPPRIVPVQMNQHEGNAA
jgi:hypothetical protein